MGQRGTSSCGWSATAYGLLLYLYPDRFRRAFGAGMREAFEHMADEAGPLCAWKTVGAELVPTLAREHAAGLAEGVGALASRSGALLFPLRVVLACAGPAAAYAWLARHATRPEDVSALTLWFAAVAAGVARTRGRGWGGAAGAVLGGAIALGGLMAHDWARGSPDVLSVAPLMLAISSLAAFALAAYVRAFVEGVELGRRRPAVAA